MWICGEMPEQGMVVNWIFITITINMIYTNTRIIDTITKPEEYMQRSVELGHRAYFTTNHGCSSNVFEAYDLCKQYNQNCIFGMELYFVYDRLQKTKSNYHIIVVALNREGYRQLNYIIQKQI